MVSSFPGAQMFQYLFDKRLIKKGKNISSFDYTGAILAREKLKQDETINIHLLKNSEIIGSLKIVPSEIHFQFSAK